MTTIKGFDYRTHEAVEKTKAEWQALLAQVIRNGGWRRIEGKETFIHRADAHIMAEIYAVIPAPKGR